MQLQRRLVLRERRQHYGSEGPDFCAFASCYPSPNDGRAQIDAQALIEEPGGEAVKYVRYVRYLLGVALLIVVWFHAHWSVALSLSLLALSVEGQVILWQTLAGKAGRRDTR